MCCKRQFCDMCLDIKGNKVKYLKRNGRLPTYNTHEISVFYERYQNMKMSSAASYVYILYYNGIVLVPGR